MKKRNNSTKKSYKASGEMTNNNNLTKPQPHLFINMNVIDEQDSTYKQQKLEVSESKNITPNENNEQAKISSYIQSRLYLLSSIIGDTKPKENRIKGYVGLLIWTLNIIIHFSFDFYEATFLFHVSWASSIGIYFLMFVICTVYIIKHTVRWYAKAIKKLAREKIYESTLQNLHFVFKVVPVVMFICSVSGAAAQYGCYAYDDALKVDFNSNSNGTTVVPEFIEIMANVIRFTSLSHIYYTMFLILILNIIVFFTVVHSQRRFNESMGQELKAHPPSMTFQEAVNKFATRTKLLRGASENTTVVLTTLLLTTSVSFVVNAYNFLFIKNFAIYVWFAIAPLFWTIPPLIGGALVTSSFQQLKLIVIQSWVEIPEKYDELWNRAQNEPVKKQPNPDWRKCLNNMRAKKSEKNNTIETRQDEVTNIRKPRSESDLTYVRPRKGSRVSSFFSYGKRKNAVANGENNTIIVENDSKAKSLPSKHSSAGLSNTHEEKVHSKANLRKAISLNSNSLLDIQQSSSNSYSSSSDPYSNNSDSNTSKTNQSSLSQSDESVYNNIPSDIENNNSTNDIDLKSVSSINSSLFGITVENDFTKESNTEDDELNKIHKSTDQTDNRVTTPIIRITSVDENISSTDKNPTTSKTSSIGTKLAKVVGVAQNIHRLRKARRKFNYEKYIKFLELTLDTIGFSLGKVTITWDRASFFMVLLLTLVGVFAQNAFLK